MTAVLLTGFPGPLASPLVAHLAAELPQARFTLVVRASHLGRARDAVARITGLEGRCELVVGDVRRPALGLGKAELEALRDTTHVWHLAASRDLALSHAQAYTLHVDGTAHLLDLCASLEGLQLVHHVSTVHVSGDRTGRVYEDELDAGQGFKNAWEASRHWAERHVRRVRDRLPVLVHRPASLAGGGDCPLDRLVAMARHTPRRLPLAGASGRAPLNVVPVDWVVSSMVAVATATELAGATLAWADPQPLRADEVQRLIARGTGHPWLVRLPPVAAGPVLRRARRLGLSPEALAYLDHPVEFDTAHASAALEARAAPACPRPTAWLPTLWS